MSPRARAAVVGGGMLALAVAALAVFVLPFAYTTPSPIVTRFGATAVFSPNADGRRDVARVSVRLHDPSRVTLDVLSGDGTVVRTLIDGKRLPVGFTRPRWDGRDDQGRVVLDGAYVLRLRAESGRKKFNISRRIVVDTVAPRPKTMTTASAVLDGPGVGECRTVFEAADAGTLTLEAVAQPGGRALAALGPRPVAANGTVRWNWDGGDRSGPVTPGLYLIRATLGEAPGNRTVRLRTCWVGHAIGHALPPRPRPGSRVGARLTTVAGRPIAGSTPASLALYRRQGTPGVGLGTPLGPRVGGLATGRLGRITVRLPKRLRADALWLVARTRDARVLIPLGRTP